MPSALYVLRTNAKVIVRKLFELHGVVYYVDATTGERNCREAKEWVRVFREL